MKNKMYIIYDEWKIQFIDEIIEGLEYSERAEVFMI